MKNLKFVNVFSYLIVTFLVIMSLQRCSKDHLNYTDGNRNEQKAIKYTNMQPVAIDAAKSFFEKGINSVANNLSGNHTNIPINPIWKDAYLSNSNGGVSFTVVPLEDSVLLALNGGVIHKRLIFNSLGGDTINMQLVLICADSQYYAHNQQSINFNTFSGQYLFFDIGSNFQYGVNVENGQSTGWIDSVALNQNNGVVDSRDLIECPPDVVIWEDCMYAIQACTTTVDIWINDCPDQPGAGGPGNGGNNSGGGGYNGNGNPNNNGTLSPWAQAIINAGFEQCIYWGVPVGIFLNGGGHLPPGVTINMAVDLQKLHKICQFNNPQLTWLTNNANIANFFLNYVVTHGSSSEVIEALKNVIEAKIRNPNVGLTNNIYTQLLDIQINANLSAGQLDWLLLHQEAIRGIYEYKNSNNNSPDLKNTIVMHVYLMMSYPSYQSSNAALNYPSIGSEQWAHTLKIMDEDPNSEEIALCLQYPLKAMTVYNNSNIAFQKTQAFFSSWPPITFHNGVPDAFRHGIWNALNARDIGAGLTTQFGNAHESSTPIELTLEKQMDLYNNAVGVILGTTVNNPTNDILSNAAFDYISIGLFEFLDPLDWNLSPRSPFGLNGIIPQTLLVPTHL